jgi:membrane protease subunit HflC
MQSRLPTVLAALVLLAVLVTYMCTFQIRETEVGFVKTFGEADQNILDDPGLYAKWPWPVQEIVKYDKRIRILDDTVEETPTTDSKNVTITTFTGWVIADPYRFHTAYRDLDEGINALRTKIRAHKKAVVGQHTFAEFVSTDPQTRKLREIENEMRDLVAREAMEGFGVEIKIFGIKRLGLPEAVTKEIFDAMKTREQNKADNYEAEGKAKAEEIVARARAARNRILAVAQRRADRIRADALAKVGEIYEQFAAHPELRIFLDQLRALEEILKQRTTLILTTNDVPVNLFDEDKRIEKPADAHAATEPPVRPDNARADASTSTQQP